MCDSRTHSGMLKSKILHYNCFMSSILTVPATATKKNISQSVWKVMWHLSCRNHILITPDKYETSLVNCTSVNNNFSAILCCDLSIETIASHSEGI